MIKKKKKEDISFVFRAQNAKFISTKQTTVFILGLKTTLTMSKMRKPHQTRSSSRLDRDLTVLNELIEFIP